jgi:hypothetical protein
LIKNSRRIADSKQFSYGNLRSPGDGEKSPSYSMMNSSVRDSKIYFNFFNKYLAADKRSIYSSFK